MTFLTDKEELYYFKVALNHLIYEYEFRQRTYQENYEKEINRIKGILFDLNNLVEDENQS